ncbi:MAG TPA: hypothetical protein VMB52_02505 [Verrucomicrobiae bacterium]|nr:hypothetical protein [Verrucomicrobiae bacterium]
MTTNQQLTITKISDGLSVGDGSISGAAITVGAGSDVMVQVDEAIASPEVLVDVSCDDNGQQIDDDGCGDGRPVKVVMRGHELLHRSLNRAKVFGGGSTMTVADLIGFGTSNDTLLATFRDAVNELAKKMINFGAHTAEHVTSPNKCGCGAIDEAPAVITWAAEHHDSITRQFEALGVSTEGLNDILDNYTLFAQRIAGQSFNGADVMQLIVDRGKIVKQLGGVHVEARIVLNYVPNKTLNQSLIHSVSGGKVDIFGVDVWRMQELAADLHPGNGQAEYHAFQAMLVYTLAVAAVLTKGDLPVYTIKPAVQREPALVQV